MTDSEKLDLILSEMQSMKTEVQSTKVETKSMKAEIQSMKAEIQSMKAEIQSMKAEIQSMKADMQNMKTEIQEIKQRTINIELHIENVTDKNIQLLAENYVELTKKLNQAIPVADKNLAYEVKVNYLVEKVQALEKEVADLKSKIA